MKQPILSESTKTEWGQQLTRKHVLYIFFYLFCQLKRQGYINILTSLSFIFLLSQNAGFLLKCIAQIAWLWRIQTLDVNPDWPVFTDSRPGKHENTFWTSRRPPKENCPIPLYVCLYVCMSVTIPSLNHA